LNQQKDFDFLTTGHSLGGRLAAAASRLTGKQAIIFNAAGLDEESIMRPGGVVVGKIAHYAVEGEAISWVQDELRTLSADPDLQRRLSDLVTWIESIVQAANLEVVDRMVEQYRVLLPPLAALRDQLAQGIVRIGRPPEDLPRYILRGVSRDGAPLEIPPNGWLIRLLTDLSWA
jgi:hypothetical protein